jgi:hypothetical protein
MKWSPQEFNTAQFDQLAHSFLRKENYMDDFEVKLLKENSSPKAEGDRISLLEEAIELTGGSRNADYGDPYDNHKLIASIATLTTGKELTAYDIVLVQMATKLARMRVTQSKRDHYVDLAAYTGIAYECLLREDSD